MVLLAFMHVIAAVDENVVWGHERGETFKLLLINTLIELFDD